MWHMIRNLLKSNIHYPTIGRELEKQAFENQVKYFQPIWSTNIYNCKTAMSWKKPTELSVRMKRHKNM